MNKLLRFFCIHSLCKHSHKKRKDSLESSLDRVLFTTELQHTSDVNTEYAGKLKQLYIFSDQPPGVQISLCKLDYFFVLILICI